MRWFPTVGLLLVATLVVGCASPATAPASERGASKDEMAANLPLTPEPPTPNVDSTPVPTGRIESSLRADPARSRVLGWFKNLGGATYTIMIVKVSWNWCPIKEKLPLSITLKPGQEQNLEFTPTDSRAPLYGEVVDWHWQALVRGRVVSGSEGGGPAGWGSPGVGLIRKATGGSSTEVIFSTPDGVPPCELRNLTVYHGKQRLIDGLKGLDFKPPSLFHPSTKYSAPRELFSGVWELPPNTNFLMFELHPQTHPVVAAFDWRQSPWAPWESVHQKLDKLE